MVDSFKELRNGKTALVREDWRIVKRMSVKTWAGETARQIEAPTAKPEDLSLTPRTRMDRADLLISQVIL